METGQVLTESQVKFEIKASKFMTVTEEALFNLGDVTSKVGGYMAAFFLFLFQVVVPLLSLRFLVKMADVVRLQYRCQYRSELAEAILRYQGKDNNSRALDLSECIETLENCFDELTSKHLRLEENLMSIHDIQNKEESSALFT